jgi:DNA-binding MarR family transcriptional regulator
VTPARGAPVRAPDLSAEAAHAVWAAMCELVLDNERRREVVDAVGLSFGRVRALRRLLGGPLSMGELASALTIDAPNATTVVDDLEELGLVRRGPHPTDRRAKLVELTRRGRDVARRADVVLARPPAALLALEPTDLETLARILEPLRQRP